MFTIAYKVHPHGRLQSMTVRAKSSWEARKKVLARLCPKGYSYRLHEITIAGMEVV